LANVVGHRQLHLPILGAPGVAAHEVARRSGFQVRYATVRAKDLPAYLDNGLVATEAMRQPTFTLWDRLVLIPVELVLALKSIGPVGGIFFLIVTWRGGISTGIEAILAYLGAVLAGIVLGPALLPWLPARSFAVKGALAGLAWTAAFAFLGQGHNWGPPATIAAFCGLPAVSAFYTLNFTGCTPFTSRSGVKKEMRLALPLIGCCLAISLLIALVGSLI
jgi:hypothetical protein